MFAIDFCVHHEAVDCPFESVNEVFFEVWSPLNPNLVFRVVNETTFPSPPTETTSGIKLRFFPSGSNSHTDAFIPFQQPIIHSTDVILVVHVYSNQPRDPLEPRSPQLLRHVSSCCLFGADVGQVIRPSTHLMENKWLGNTRQHTVLHFEIERSPSLHVIPHDLSPSEFWESKLLQIWTDFIQPEIQWMGSPQSRNVLAMTPISMTIHGMPVHCAATGDDYSFNVSKGLSSQALWIPPAHPVVTEAWLVGHLTEILSVHDSTPDEFLRVNLTQWGEPLQKALSDVVKLMTIHTTTWPYTTDHVLTGEDGKSVTIDCMEIARTKPGDCEDSAAMAMQICMDVLKFKRNSDSPVVKRIRQLIGILGVPCAINATVSNPLVTNEIDLPCHMLAGFVPVPQFVGPGFDRAAFLREFELTEMPHIPLHCALMEATVLSTPYYTTRSHLAAEKSAKTLLARQVLTKMVGETDPGMWKNYCIPLPFSENSERGYQLHHGVYRLTTPARSFFEPAAPDDQVESWVVYGPKGELGVRCAEFFGTKPCKWTMRMSTPKPKHVYDLECEISRQFLRPFPVPLDYRTDQLPQAVLHRVDRNKRLIVFCYVYVDGETEQLIERVQRAIGSMEKKRIRYGHGHMYVLYF